ncbi:type IV pilin protein [Methyloterricola oryzae]|uniref:type IV pilin protein n=1 Tax=Methyloterricola oryzae TaxID=1495050 RepID=UPI0005EB4D45|nr:prepilin-type N-terminal cleavage/methylation domain-containing protein [Methyloterricola oryzae]
MHANSNPQGRPPQSGFTLQEIMMALAVVAVLTAIALPAYRGYTDKARNKAAIGDLLKIQTQIQEFYTEQFRYPTNLAEIASRLPNGGNDPWGRPYVYLNIANGGPSIMGSVRKDHALNPINSDYDLYSKGKNGLTQVQITNQNSVDDIIRARDGGFVGLSSDF